VSSGEGQVRSGFAIPKGKRRRKGGEDENESVCLCMRPRYRGFEKARKEIVMAIRSDLSGGTQTERDGGKGFYFSSLFRGQARGIKYKYATGSESRKGGKGGKSG